MNLMISPPFGNYTQAVFPLWPVRDDLLIFPEKNVYVPCPSSRQD